MIRFVRVLCLQLAVVLACFTASHAEEQYRTEVSALYSRTDYEWGGRSLNTGAALEFFLAPVSPDNHPYAEAAYLEQIGSIGVSAVQTDYKFGTQGSSGSGDGWTYNLVVNYTLPDSPLIAKVEWMRFDYDSQSISNSILMIS